MYNNLVVANINESEPGGDTEISDVLSIRHVSCISSRPSLQLSPANSLALRRRLYLPMKIHVSHNE